MYPLLNFVVGVMFIISIIAVIRPLPALKLPTRKAALIALVASFILAAIVQQLKPPPTPEELARIEEQDRKEIQRRAERERERQERERHREQERLARLRPTDITFREIHSRFGLDSPLTDLQKKTAWKTYKGKCIQWQGQLVHLDEGLLGGIVIGFKHLPDTFTYDVLVSAQSP